MLQNWTAVYERKDDAWVAWCAEAPETGVVGGSLDEVRRLLSEAMEEVARERLRSQELTEQLSDQPLAD
jgi:predicted RNase H-like HicB family nuclease